MHFSWLIRWCLDLNNIRVSCRDVPLAWREIMRVWMRFMFLRSLRRKMWTSVHLGLTTAITSAWMAGFLSWATLYEAPDSFFVTIFSRDSAAATWASSLGHAKLRSMRRWTWRRWTSCSACLIAAAMAWPCCRLLALRRATQTTSDAIQTARYALMRQQDRFFLFDFRIYVSRLNSDHLIWLTC
jgi:hypothetical protein